MKRINSAFSLIELIVVVAIVSVLVAIAIPVYSRYTERARMKDAYMLINQYLKEWMEVNDTGNWYEWNIDDRYRGNSGFEYLSGVYINWQNISFSFLPGYFDREAETWVVYYPVADGVPVIDMNNASELNGAEVITWTCDVGGPPGIYYGGLNRLEFRDTYFPDCDCSDCL